ncbi:uncharacterized protein N7498_001748 [Penicillium cinerascens]|uniref:ferric-chelate reductase (NADPH) n=1 Tax=Penicillium cinerascens TaxID=70096 RepID=A0A9W9N8W9_9EURO|nr:uncharacterized protein N7498_001748 [Penicillium cinerascens]KAJ5215341.1 hypothetical protein N7498_001748 [Penicillium cinerascens]
MALLIPTTHLSFLADIVGVSLMACRRMHRVVGWMTAILLGFHITLLMSNHQRDWSLRKEKNFFALIGAVSTGALVCFSFSFIRQHLFEMFIRTHQGLAAVFVYSTWRHLSSTAFDSQIYIYVSLGLLGITTVVHIALFVFRNGVFPSRPHPRASITCARAKEGLAHVGQEGTPLRVRVLLSRPLRVKAGQYVNLWMPTVSLVSWTQSHPFMVTSWSPEKQNVLEFFVQSRRGLTKTIHSRAALDGFASYTAFVSGPYGASKSMDDYECVLAVATDFGIAGVISYLKKLVYGYNTSTSYVRRVHFVWQVQSLDIAVAAQSFLNDLLSDDVLDNGYILEISFYVNFGRLKEAFGIHGRAAVFNGDPNYENIVLEEASGKYISRLPNTSQEQGKALVLEYETS